MASKYHSASLTEEQGGVEDDDSESSWTFIGYCYEN